MVKLKTIAMETIKQIKVQIKFNNKTPAVGIGKKAGVYMASINLIDSFQEFKDAENIDHPTLMKVMEDVFKTLIRKKYGSDECFDVIVNDQKGDLEIFRRRTIVEDDDLYNTLTEIEYKDAIKIEPGLPGW